MDKNPYEILGVQRNDSAGEIQNALPLLRRIHSGSYDRLTAEPPESHAPSGRAHNRASDIADWEAQSDHGEGPG